MWDILFIIVDLIADFTETALLWWQQTRTERYTNDKVTCLPFLLLKKHIQSWKRSNWIRLNTSVADVLQVKRGNKWFWPLCNHVDEWPTWSMITTNFNNFLFLLTIINKIYIYFLTYVVEIVLMLKTFWQFKKCILERCTVFLYFLIYNLNDLFNSMLV